MNEAFDARSLTISLVGYQRAAIDQIVNKEDKILDIKFTVATFDPGYVQTGASEFPFSITLPSDVTETFLLQLLEGGLILSKTFFL
jgi:hypothetical protein